MATAADIEVAVEAAGADEARQELQGVSESIEDTTDEMSESSGELAGLQRRWSGAFSAMTAGLAVASGFLLSQVPVLGEAMAGLGSIVEAVAFQMDQTLRPVLGPVADILFDISDFLFDLEGIAGDVVGVLGTLATVFGLVLLPVAKLVSMVTGFSGALAVLKAVGAAILGVITSLVSALSAPVLIGGALVAAVALIIEEFIGWKNVIDGIVSLASDLFDTLTNITGAVWDFTLNLVGDAVGLIGDVWDTLVDIVGTAGGAIWEFTMNLLGDAVGLLGDAWDTLTDIVGAAGGAVWEFTLNLLGGALGALGDAWDTLVDIAGDTVSETWSTFLFVFGGALDFLEDVLDTLQKIAVDSWNTVVEIAVELGEILGISGDDFYDPGKNDLDDGFLPDLTDFVPFLQDGGILQSDGLFYGHAGEVVVPPDAAGDADTGLGSGTPFLANQAQTINVNIDGREVAEATKQYEDRETNVRGRFGSSG